MRVLYLVISFLIVFQAQAEKLKTYASDHHWIKYMGRIDFSNPLKPRFWQPGVTVQFRFEGEDALIYLQDEQLWGTNQNYIELIVDGREIRLQTKGRIDTISVKKWLGTGKSHTVILCKNTEANIGYLEFLGISCKKLLPPTDPLQRKIEFIGNSITCGASADESGIPCGGGKWQDQHNAWLSYGAVLSRKLSAQYHLNSVSGIGLIRSCCQMDILMPQVYDKISMRNNAISWDFSLYQPDLVSVCLGQNDGIQDSTKFTDAYIKFVTRLREYYPRASLLLISSPMAHPELREFHRSCLKAVVGSLQNRGFTKLDYFVFEQSYTGGCDYHPSVDEHRQIAEKLEPVVKKFMRW